MKSRRATNIALFVLALILAGYAVAAPAMEVCARTKPGAVCFPAKEGSCCDKAGGKCEIKKPVSSQPVLEPRTSLNTPIPAHAGISMMVSDSQAVTSFNPEFSFLSPPKIFILHHAFLC